MAREVTDLTPGEFARLMRKQRGDPPRIGPSKRGIRAAHAVGEMLKDLTANIMVRTHADIEDYQPHIERALGNARTGDWAWAYEPDSQSYHWPGRDMQTRSGGIVFFADHEDWGGGEASMILFDPRSKRERPVGDPRVR